MNLLTKASLLTHILRWRLTWEKRDTNYRPKKLNPDKFVSAMDAVKLIEDGSTIISSGMAGNGRCSIFFWAVKELFLKSGHPRNLTWITVGAQGSRGRAPGTIEEIGFPDLITTYISGHAETEKEQLKLAEQGHIELHTMPQGVQTFLLEAQGKGDSSIKTNVGVGTFLDPRIGTGTAVTKNAKNEFVKVSGQKLEYTLPKVDVSICTAPYADREGNIYFHNAATITENIEGAQASIKNGGIALIAVSAIIPKDPSRISIPAKMVSKIVVNPGNEQTAGVPQKRYWPMFTVGGNADVKDAVDQLKFVNTVMKITPYRGPVENALARLAASLFTSETKKGAIINIGVGMPEEVCRLLYESGLYKDLTFTSETGVYGGLPTPGIYFGAAINPERLDSSAQMFHLYESELDVAVLGLLQVDSDGNVNVSKRGPKVTDYVGPGGFPNIVEGAKTIIFVGSWMAHAKFAINDGKLVIEKPGTHKFMEQVDEITFSGKQALKKGKKVIYVTNVGVFRLTKKGLEIRRVMPGVDIQKDIIDACPCKFVLPKNEEVKVVREKIVTGKGFVLDWNN